MLDRAIAKPTATARLRCCRDEHAGRAGGFHAHHGGSDPQFARAGDRLRCSCRRARRFSGILFARGGGYCSDGARNQCGRGARGLRRRQARRDSEPEGGERRRSLPALVCIKTQSQHRCGHRRGRIVALLHGGRGAESAPHRCDRAQRCAIAWTRSTAAQITPHGWNQA